MNSGSRQKVEGFLNLFKPQGWTSHDVVQLVRRLAETRRVGHAGTLDPAATGVLVVAVGRATRLIDYLATQDKLYLADVVLGAATDTDDAEGTILYSRDTSHLTLEQIVSAMGGFLGEIEQVPPQFSAIKLGGRKAYEVARRGGSLELAARRVSIRGMAVVGWEPPLLRLLVRCSKGTYIRSLARDLGEALGVGGHLGGLLRLSSGAFSSSEALSIEELREAAEKGELARHVRSPDSAVAHLPSLAVSPRHAGDMLSGRPWAVDPDFVAGELVRVYSEDGTFLGLAERAGDHWQPKLVFAEAQDSGRQLAVGGESEN